MFKSVFGILNSEEWEECREKLLATMKNYDYIYSILTALMENSLCFKGMAELEKEICRQELRADIRNLVS